MIAAAPAIQPRNADHCPQFDNGAEKWGMVNGLWMLLSYQNELHQVVSLLYVNNHIPVFQIS